MSGRSGEPGEGTSLDERRGFFKDIYRRAGGDPGLIPWADLAAKATLHEWLVRHPGQGRLTAIDIACGLGDNADALARAGYVTTAFDLSEHAIGWARRRFPDSGVEFVVADLFALPESWRGAFDLVNECYTLQSLSPDMLDDTAASIASLVRPGGTLLVYARWREDGAQVEGPPWPLEKSRLRVFEELGFTLSGEKLFTVDRHGRKVPHSFAVWKREEGIQGE
ncbi:class I SAM-dependent methyltransferase [Oricola thermophila]|uniref:Class I SAM-dependent methyltransferase n=1 Tax=Oricola thermophila TaxID=2742145 RepID=A0A6N1VFN2_9HYPH|nr:class I SAM-dependent methyltransferase [Oricola thermophila]QKV18415.1 class I SAM-dependent methyltransferase [Oricola thermophila]